MAQSTPISFYTEGLVKTEVTSTVSVLKSFFLLQAWELLVLNKINWELFAVTTIDYLGHVIPRIEPENFVDAEELRSRIETILVLIAKEYQFCFHLPSLIAGSALIIAYQSLSIYSRDGDKKIFNQVQAVTNSSHVSENY